MLDEKSLLELHVVLRSPACRRVARTRVAHGPMLPPQLDERFAQLEEISLSGRVVHRSYQQQFAFQLRCERNSVCITIAVRILLRHAEVGLVQHHSFWIERRHRADAHTIEAGTLRERAKGKLPSPGPPPHANPVEI